MSWKIILIPLFIISLASCQSLNPATPANVIIPDAHGGGSIVQFNHNETILASGGWSGYIRLWSVPQGSSIYGWKAHTGEVTGIFFSDDDKHIISSSLDGSLKLWSANGKLIIEKNDLPGITSLLVNNTDKLIITGHRDGIVRVWQASDLSLVKQRKQHIGSVLSLAYTEQDKIIASSGSDSDVILWPDTKKSIKLRSSQTDIRTLVFTEKGKVLLGGGWFNLHRWTLQDGNLQILGTEHFGLIRNMDSVDNGAALASISRNTDSAVLFLDSKSGQVTQRFQSHDLCGADISISARQSYLATTSDDASVRIWWLKQPGQDIQK